MPLSTAERDLLTATVRAIPFDLETVLTEHATARARALARASEIKATGKTDAEAIRQAKEEGHRFEAVTFEDVQPAWEARRVEVVVIGDPAYVRYLFDERSKNLDVTLVGWHDKQSLRGHQISVNQRGQRGALRGITRGSALHVASYYTGRVRPGHGEIDGLLVAPHIDQTFELTAFPVPALLEAWLPKVGIGGRVVVGGMNLKACQVAVANWVDAGVLEHVGDAGNCWAGVKAQDAGQEERV